MINSATIAQATPKGYYDAIFFIAVLTPSGTIFGCIGSSSTCDLIGFTATSAGTYQCTVPFGGAAASLSVSTTGGVSALSDCAGSDSTTWTGISSNTCPGVGNVCSGAAGLADLTSTCSTAPGFIGFGTLSPSTGSTSQAGTYQVLTCWNFLTPNPASVQVVTNTVPTTSSFQILPSVVGVPQFPLGPMMVFAIAIPALILIRSRTRIVRKRNS